MPEKSTPSKTPVLCQPTSSQSTSSQYAGSNTTCSMTFRNTGQMDRDGNMLYKCNSNCNGD